MESKAERGDYMLDSKKIALELSNMDLKGDVFEIFNRLSSRCGIQYLTSCERKMIFQMIKAGKSDAQFFKTLADTY